MDFKRDLQSTGKSQGTVKRYHQYALDFIAFLDGEEIEAENTTANEVLAYLDQLQKQGDSNATRNIKLNAIKQFFDWQVRQGHRGNNPIQHLKLKGIKQRKLYPILNRQELDQLYMNYSIPTKEDAKGHKHWFEQYRLSRQRNKVIIGLMVHQGLTTAEVNRIKTKDLKLREGELYISGSRKSNERTLQLKSSQMLELMEYALQARLLFMNYQQDKNTDYLFLAVPSSGKAKATERTGAERLEIWKSLSAELRKQHTKFINFKQVRTSVITHWLKQYNLREVQYRAGHRYVSSTEAYQVNQIEDLQADIDKFHPMG